MEVSGGDLQWFWSCVVLLLTLTSTHVIAFNLYCKQRKVNGNCLIQTNINVLSKLIDTMQFGTQCYFI